MRNEPCFCGSGKKQKKCHKDIPLNSAFAEIFTLQRTLDEKIEERKGEILCQKGCSSCCYEAFSISNLEYNYLMNYVIENYGETKAKQLVTKGHSIWKEIEQKIPTLSNVLKSNIEGAFSYKKLEDIYRSISGSSKLDYPCPLLDEETQSCIVYDVRPIVCRTYGVAYTERNEQPFTMCEKIKDGLTYQKELANVTEHTEDIDRWMRFNVRGKTIVYDRPYPIFYFMKLQYNNWENTKAKIKEYKEHSFEQVMRIRLARLQNRQNM